MALRIQESQVNPSNESQLDIKLREGARAAVMGQCRIIARQYKRSDALARLRAPARLESAHDRQVVRWLKKALRNERGKAIAGHWNYDANRHLLLRAALKSELSRKCSDERSSCRKRETPPAD
ncbi:MAG: hypothetical protein KDJ62_07330 [Rhodobiaceae bacterium]|nr:hypothetical protein [Rhodobiaceae bacterium]MCC0048508.1 hypothetical protein [Rhodobiaceae bacterium]